MTIAILTFAMCLSFCAYIYFGYPLLMLLLARLRPRPVRREAIQPSVSLIVPVHNEESVVAEKIENSLALDYPRERLEILVVSDGSTDGTEAVVSRFEKDGVRLLSLPRRGKAHALNEGVSRAKGAIVVLTDANAMLTRESLSHLVSNFADPEVGGVCGNQKYRTAPGADATERGENLYWRLDKWIKSQESAFGSIFAADGSLYGLRRELYCPIVEPAQADDIAISTRVVLQGKRLVYEPLAVAFEDPPVEGMHEFQRKIRVTNHSVRALLSLGSRLWTSGFYSFELLSHKLFRHLVPFALVPLFAANAALWQGPLLFQAALALHVAFYALAAAGFLARGTPAGKTKLLSVPFYFCLANAAALFGVIDILLGRRVQAWTPRTGAISEASGGAR